MYVTMACNYRKNINYLKYLVLRQLCLIEHNDIHHAPKFRGIIFKHICYTQIKTNFRNVVNQTNASYFHNIEVHVHTNM